MSEHPDVFEHFDPVALTALQARQLPRMPASAIAERTEQGDPAEAARIIAAFDDYFQQFHFERRDQDARRCLCCGIALTGLFGAFTWGLAFGEGHCGQCRYPARAIHHVKGTDGVELCSLTMVLQYHPDELSFPAKEAVSP